MATLKTTIRTPSVVRTLVRGVGREGYDSYEIAVLNGFVGTESQWLASLKGDKGDTATVQIGTVSSVPFPGPPTVTNVGTNEDAILDFGLVTGEKGNTGDAATIQVGTTQTLAPGSAATVTNSGTSGAAILNFGIPQGLVGPMGEVSTAQLNAAIALALHPLRPVVLTQPLAASGNVGDSLSISCLGGILPNTHLNLTYQWQLSTDAGVSYSNISGATSPTIPFNPALVGNNGLYRCRLTNAFGSQDTNAVSLTVSLNIASLYAGGHRGIAWDLDQIGTLWQNSTGTTPVTAYGDPVGRVDGVSGNGNAWVQATSSRRPTYARRPKSGIRNLLQRTEDLSNSYWQKINSLTPSSTRVTENTVNGEHRIQNQTQIPVIAGQTLSLSFSARAGERSRIRAGFDNLTTINARAFFDLTTGTTDNGIAGSTYSITPDNLLGPGWFRCRVTGTALANANVRIEINLVSSLTTAIYLGDGNSGAFLTNLQLEVSNSPTAYQRVTNQFDVTETGQPSINYLWFDGIDDCMQSATAIDFSNSDEMTICLAQRRLSDVNTGTLIELGTAGATAGNFDLRSPRSNGSSVYRFLVSGAAASIESQSSSFPAPAFHMLTAQAKIGQPRVSLAVNRTETQNTTLMGVRNFNNEILHIGSRGQSALFFSGHLNSGFVINRTLNPLVLADFERYWVAAKAGIDLP